MTRDADPPAEGAPSGDLTAEGPPGGDPAGGDPAVRRLLTAVSRLAGQTRGRPRTGRTHQDADDDAGTVGTDDAVGFDPFPLLRALDRAGARIVVIGQVAGIMHGSAELTGDLDLLWDGGPAQAAPLVAAFAACSARLTDDDGRPVPCDPEAFARPKVLFRTTTASGDCCTPALPWGLPVADFISRCEVASAGDFAIRYLSRPDLIAMRLAIGRPKDLRRAQELQSLGLSPRRLAVVQALGQGGRQPGLDGRLAVDQPLEVVAGQP